jgi:Domain of unknown function (DUF4279)
MIWFGGPVDKFVVTLRFSGEDLDPNRISALLGCAPTMARPKGAPISSREGAPLAKKGQWHLTIESKDGDCDDVEDGIKALLARLPADPALWASLTSMYKADVFCGLFLETENRGFTVSAEISKTLSDRHLDIGFDIYFGPAEGSATT